MLRLIDTVGEFSGRFAAWMFFVIGGMITYEVVARYVFNAPTIWAEEMSRFFQIWATYLAAAYVLRHRHMIRITLLVDRLGARARRWAEAFSLICIAGFCGVAIWWGVEIVVDSIEKGRASSTMLGVPKWYTEIAIPIGFGLLLLQCLALLARLIRGEDLGEDRIEEQM